MAEAQVGTFYLYSWNTKGLNQPVKSTNILTHLANLKTALLHGTYLISQDVGKLKQKWFGQVFVIMLQ